MFCFGQKIHIGLILLTAIAMSVTATTFAAEANWLVDFEKATEMAKKEGKDMLLDFTGSDWCSFCIKLEREVFSKDVFVKKIPENFVLVKVDNPRDKSKQSEAEQKMVETLVAKYSISGFPTILLVDNQGRPYSSLMGYDGATAEKYVEDLLNRQEGRKKRDELLAKADAAKAETKAKLLDEALSGIDGERETILGSYPKVVDAIIESDSENKAGLKKKYSELRANVTFKSQVQQIMRSMTGPQDVAPVTKKLEDLIAKSKVGGEPRQEALFFLSQLQFGIDKAKAKSTLQAAHKAAPETEMAAQIQSVIKRFFPDKPAEEKKSEPKK